MELGQEIIFDENHHSEVYDKVYSFKNKNKEIYKKTDKYKNINLENHLKFYLDK